MKLLKNAVLAIVFFTGVMAEAATVPVREIEKVLKSYADSVGCGFLFEKNNIVEFDVDKDGRKEFIALFYVDIECARGNATVKSSLAVLRRPDDQFKDEIFVITAMSHPAAPIYGFPLVTDRIFEKNGQLWFEGRIHAENDPPQHPFIPVQSSISLIKKEMPSSGRGEHSFYYWKSKKDYYY